MIKVKRQEKFHYDMQNIYQKIKKKKKKKENQMKN